MWLRNYDISGNAIPGAMPNAIPTCLAGVDRCSKIGDLLGTSCRRAIENTSSFIGPLQIAIASITDMMIAWEGGGAKVTYELRACGPAEWSIFLPACASISVTSAFFSSCIDGATPPLVLHNVRSFVAGTACRLQPRQSVSEQNIQVSS